MTFVDAEGKCINCGDWARDCSCELCPRCGAMAVLEDFVGEDYCPDCVEILRAKVTAVLDCERYGGHDWELREDGYSRRWATTITTNDDGTVAIEAAFTGTEDWDEDGDGNYYLQCRTCMATKPMPDEYEIDWT